MSCFLIKRKVTLSLAFPGSTVYSPVHNLLPCVQSAFDQSHPSLWVFTNLRMFFQSVIVFIVGPPTQLRHHHLQTWSTSCSLSPQGLNPFSLAAITSQIMLVYLHSFISLLVLWFGFIFLTAFLEVSAILMIWISGIFKSLTHNEWMPGTRAHTCNTVTAILAATKLF